MRAAASQIGRSGGKTPRVLGIKPSNSLLLYAEQSRVILSSATRHPESAMTVGHLLTLASLVVSGVTAKEQCTDGASRGQLTGQLAVVTGASRGVGAEVARVYAREGALVVVNYFNSKEKGESVAAEINAAWPGRAFAAYGDVTVKEDMVKLVAAAEAHFGMKVSVVVNNALPKYQFNPGASMASIRTVKPEDFEQQMKGTLAGAVNTVQAALPSFEAAKFGKVVNIGSNLVYNPVVTYYDYTAAKAALVGLTRNLAAELGPMGVRVNLVAGACQRAASSHTWGCSAQGWPGRQPSFCTPLPFPLSKDTHPAAFNAQAGCSTRPTRRRSPQRRSSASSRRVRRCARPRRSTTSPRRASSSPPTRPTPSRARVSPSTAASRCPDQRKRARGAVFLGEQPHSVTFCLLRGCAHKFWSVDRGSISQRKYRLQLGDMGRCAMCHGHCINDNWNRSLEAGGGWRSGASSPAPLTLP